MARRTVVGGAALAVIGLVGAVFWGGQVRVSASGPVPTKDPSKKWSRVLARAATPDGVDYDIIARERDVLDEYVAWIGEHGPFLDEMKESAEDNRLAFLINAYNGAVIYGVLHNQPIESVRDVAIGPYRWRGTGFFVGQKFRIDGEWTTLHALELQSIINRYQEPLLHAALVCASRGCPDLRWWKGKKLQGQLEGAMKRYLSSDRGLSKQDGGWAASELFTWHEDDFLYWSDADTVCEWMVPFTEGEAAVWLDEHAEDCPLGTLEWDWSLNRIQAPVPAGELHAPASAEPDAEDEDESHDAPVIKDTGEAPIESTFRRLQRPPER